MASAVMDGPDLQHQAPSYPATTTKPLPHDPSLSHRGTRSLSTISLYGLLLGLAIGFSVSSLLYLSALDDQPTKAIWRLPFFILTLSTFHFLEFYITARHNTPVAKVSSYLLFGSNGWAWNTAHSCAMLEIVLSCTTTLGSRSSYYARFAHSTPLALTGLCLIVSGQAIRSRAMLVAGTNFNHVPVKTKSNTHVLVSHDIYSLVRHPSYFGFFYWAVGTQIAVGNLFCGVIYAVVLWRFFSARIEYEEADLVGFFGDEYVRFRARTGTGIPFIR